MIRPTGVEVLDRSLTRSVQLFQPVKIKQVFTKELSNMSNMDNGLTCSSAVDWWSIGNNGLTLRVAKKSETILLVISGIYEFVHEVVEDEKNHFGLKAADKSVKKEILTELMKGSTLHMISKEQMYFQLVLFHKFFTHSTSLFFLRVFLKFSPNRCNKEPSVEQRSALASVP